MLPFLASAQQYSGMSGLIHTPSADMDNEGDVRIGGHLMNKEFKTKVLPPYTENYSFDAYLSITPFKWVEVGFAMTFMKEYYSANGTEPAKKIPMKDRHCSIKLRPLGEGKYYPAIAIGMQDCGTNGNKDVQGYFSNYYIAMTKHINIKKQKLGLTLAYRHYIKDYNHKWNGVVGGITYVPSFARNWRGIVEWTGCDVNFGIDCLLWKHLMLQASLQNGQYPSGGICYKLNLF